MRAAQNLPNECEVAMSDHFEETRPRRPEGLTDLSNPRVVYPDETSGPGCWLWGVVILFSSVIAIGIVAVAAYAGFEEGLTTARVTATAERASNIRQQCEILPTDIANGAVTLVQRRFDDLAQNGALPQCALNYAPDATRIFIESQASATPSSTPTFTPTLTPTPLPLSTATPTLSIPATEAPTLQQPTDDGMTAQAATLFIEAQQQISTGELEEAIRTLEAMKAIAPNYRTAEVDQLLFNTLQTRALQIYRSPSSTNLAQAIALTNQAAEYGNVGELQFEATVARYYLDALGYIDISYPQAIRLLEQVVSFSSPNYKNTGTLLAEQYEGYGDTFLAGGDPCQAVQQYTSALTYTAAPRLSQKRADAQQQCNAGTIGTPQPGIEGSPDAAPTQGVAPIGQPGT